MPNKEEEYFPVNDSTLDTWRFDSSTSITAGGGYIYASGIMPKRHNYFEEVQPALSGDIGTSLGGNQIKISNWPSYGEPGFQFASMKFPLYNSPKINWNVLPGMDGIKYYYLVRDKDGSWRRIVMKNQSFVEIHRDLGLDLLIAGVYGPYENVLVE